MSVEKKSDAADVLRIGTQCGMLREADAADPDDALRSGEHRDATSTRKREAAVGKKCADAFLTAEAEGLEAILRFPLSQLPRTSCGIEVDQFFIGFTTERGSLTAKYFRGESPVTPVHRIVGADGQGVPRFHRRQKMESQMIRDRARPFSELRRRTGTGIEKLQKGNAFIERRVRPAHFTECETADS
jgi:hypothetical protein